MFGNNSFQEPQAQFDLRIGETLASRAGFLFFDKDRKVVAPQAAEILICVVPNCVFTAKDGALGVVPRDSDRITGGSESDRNTGWIYGGWLAVVQVPALGHNVQHAVFGRIGNHRGLRGGFAITAPSMERGGPGQLEQLLTDTVRELSGHFWGYRPDFVGTDVGLKETIEQLSVLLNRPVSLDLETETNQASAPVWVNGDGQLVQRNSARDKRVRDRQARQAVGAQRVGPDPDAIEKALARMGAGRVATSGTEGKVQKG